MPFSLNISGKNFCGGGRIWCVKRGRRSPPSLKVAFLKLISLIALRSRKLINKIDQALERIEHGTYGYCEESGEPISLRRLEARPIATMTIEAQERHERMERVHRDD